MNNIRFHIKKDSWKCEKNYVMLEKLIYILVFFNKSLVKHYYYKTMKMWSLIITILMNEMLGEKVQITSEKNTITC